jgi:hypothetical protein
MVDDGGKILFPELNTNVSGMARLSPTLAPGRWVLGTAWRIGRIGRRREELPER